MAKMRNSEKMEIGIDDFCKLIAALVDMLPRTKQAQFNKLIMPALQRMMTQ